MLRNSFRFSHLTNFTTFFCPPSSTHYGKEQESVEVPPLSHASALCAELSQLRGQSFSLSVVSSDTALYPPPPYLFSTSPSCPYYQPYRGPRVAHFRLPLDIV